MTATRDALPEGTPSTTGWTTIPRWTTASVPGVDDRVSALPDGMTPMLGERARELGVPVSALHLAAHAKVLAALSGDRVVTTARLTAPGWYLPCRVTVAPGTWRDLVHAAAREQELLADRGDPRADDPPGTSPRSHPDVLFDPDGYGPVLPSGAILCVTVTED
ncbi:non-ribosomal peptide synthetase, partial [Streptomyces sp. SID6041]|nr:non-ribosomal peptide synthetase [Streptomyces sp. SID6041]